MSVILPEPLKRFIWDFQSVIELAESPRELLLIGGDIFRRALAEPELLPPAFCGSDLARPALRQLYADALARFLPACLTLAPGQQGPFLPGPGWRMAGVCAGAVKSRVDQGDETILRAGQMETARAGGVTYANALPDRPALLLLVCDGGNFAAPDAPGFDNGPEAPPFDIFTIQTRIED